MTPEQREAARAAVQESMAFPHRAALRADDALLIWLPAALDALDEADAERDLLVEALRAIDGDLNGWCVSAEAGALLRRAGERVRDLLVSVGLDKKQP